LSERTNSNETIIERSSAPRTLERVIIAAERSLPERYRSAEYHRPARILVGVHRLFSVSSRPRVIYGPPRALVLYHRTQACTHAHARRRTRRRAAVNRETEKPSTFPTFRHGNVRTETRVALYRCDKSLSLLSRVTTGID